MVKFGTFVFPNVKGWGRVKPRIYLEKVLPSRNVSDRQDLGSTGYVIEVWGVITGTSEEVKNKIIEMEGKSDGIERKFDLETETPIFYALMLEPNFERVEGFSNFVPYRVRIVQTKILVEGEAFILSKGTLGVDFLA